MRLYHYTCDHGRAGIDKMGLVYPNPHPLLGVALAWFTDLEEPTPYQVGLTSETLDCDRLAHRIEVDPSLCRRWLGSNEQSRTPPWVQQSLHDLGDPGHWWIATVPVPTR